MAITVDFNDLRPGTVVRVGLRAAGPIGRTFFLRITEPPEQLSNGRIHLVGDRLTSHGNIREPLEFSALRDQLFPAVMTI